MERTLFDEDHEAFRAACRTFVERTLAPNQEKHLAERSIGRDVWLALGRQDMLGLNVPEAYGGSGLTDPRFSMVLAEELSKLAFGRPWRFGDRSVDNAIVVLRRKLGDERVDGCIRTVRGIGYVFVGFPNT